MSHQDRSNAEKLHSLWAFFSSVKLTVVLLALIVLLGVLGTLIPQRGAETESAGGADSGWTTAMDALQLTDMYRSPLFHVVLGLLSLNLIVCSLNRFPASLRAFRSNGYAGRSMQHDNRLPDFSLETNESPKILLKRLQSMMNKTYRLTGRRAVDGKEFLYADRGRYAHFGVYVIHLGILIVIAGALAGSLLGFKAYVRLMEGESSDTVYLRADQKQKKLDFLIRCDRFSIDFHDNGLPKEYRSDLVFLRDDRIVYRGALRVNHPIVFEGVRIYQSSYGPAPGARIDLGFRKGGGKKQNALLGAGDTLDLPGDRARVRVERIEENLMEMGPAVKLVIETQKKSFAFWVFQEIRQIERANPGITRQVPMFNPGLYPPYVFSLDRMIGKYFTGLQVTRDPGAPVAAAGAFLLFAGLMIVFFTSHRQIEVRVETANGRTRVGISGRSNRNPRGLQRDMQRILEELGQPPENGKYTEADP